jgi:divalent metal cation (Fe/Co/Zn/Cd) transporter
MNQIDWAWLGQTFAQVFGMGVNIAVFSFAYERAVREHINLLKIWERDHLVRWFALGFAIFSMGLIIGEASWLQKAASLGLTIYLGWAAWQSRK